MNKFLFVAVLANGGEVEKWVDAETMKSDGRLAPTEFNKKTARKYFWEFVLTDEQRDNCECIETVDMA
jgi:hypothetical protein